jgi:hypothetical protein
VVPRTVRSDRESIAAKHCSEQHSLSRSRISPAVGCSRIRCRSNMRAGAVTGSPGVTAGLSRRVPRPSPAVAS